MVKILQWYKTVTESGTFTETEKRSKFISFVFFVEDEGQVQNHLKEIKQIALECGANKCGKCRRSFIFPL